MRISKLLFAVVAVVQLAVPASLIVRHELTLQQGQMFKFKTAPVDPYDAFRGRYVALRFEQNVAPVVAGEKLACGQKGYATLETDKDGFAKLHRRQRHAASRQAVPACSCFVVERFKHYDGVAV
jgi:uncharacterized membrane-anchored protein